MAKGMKLPRQIGKNYEDTAPHNGAGSYIVYRAFSAIAGGKSAVLESTSIPKLIGHLH